MVSRDFTRELKDQSDSFGYKKTEFV